jgi:aspartyl-tRNA synthetase
MELSGKIQERSWAGTLDAGAVGRPVLLRGWVRKSRDLGGLVFFDLRDRSGIVQIVADPDRSPAEALATARELRSEFVVEVQGRVVRRQAGMENRDLATGEIEIVASGIRIWAEAETPPFSVEDDLGASEELRLRYRYLDLRRPTMTRNLLQRHRTTLAARGVLDRLGFIEVETPILTRSTPEGARDFLVPSRVHRGTFYALPQSPQLFKQLLMVSGLERYFQIARCFRDEDLRADRQPEFTQIDVEMSFPSEEELFGVVEEIFREIFPVAGIACPTPFPRMTYDEAIRRFGIDRPDTRFGLELFDATEAASASAFAVFAGAKERGHEVRGIVLPGGAGVSRKRLDDLTETAKLFGAKGLVWIKREPSGWSSPAKKHLEEAIAERIFAMGGVAEGDLVLLVADRPKIVADALANLRLRLGREEKLIPKDRHDFLWVTDFPLVEWDEPSNRWFACHHPFTSPREADVPRLESDPGSVRARAYDVVLDGLELGGGSIRIHRPDLQSRMFRVLGIGEAEAKEKFGFLLDAFRYGAPPHGGFALGLDRICMILAGASSLRDVIAFPKTTSGACLMTSSPAGVDSAALDDLGIALAKPKPAGS